MAAALPSHISFFTDVRKLPGRRGRRGGAWLAFYKANRAHFTDGVTYPLLADPLEKTWTALQTWNPERGPGALLAFRQEGDDATRTIALRNVARRPLPRSSRAPDGAVLGTVAAAQLRDGIRVEIARAPRRPRAARPAPR